MLGALRSDISPAAPRWEVSTGWRYQHSDRHFSGSNEQYERAEEDSEVKNTLNLGEVGIRRYFNSRTSLALNIPYLIAERSSPIRDENDVVVDRTVTHAQGLSDISLTLRRSIWKPEDAPRGNVTGGIGVKLPTGSTSVQDTRTTLEDGEFINEVRTVDQSIQPGDGGFGIILDLQGHRRLFSRTAWYGAATYLSNPRGKNGAMTYRGDEREAEMSVPDQYLARTGFVASMPFYDPLALSIGGRLEGVPSHDMIGPSDGFRRPGYSFAVEPGVSWSKASHTVSVAVPVALARERVKNYADLADGGHGDAAFADYVVLLGYWRHF